MTNLLEETREGIRSSGRTVYDVAWVGSDDGEYSISWEEFEEIANVNYDSGFGGAEVAKDLVVVFRDGSNMWRGEYDGSEWWEYSKPIRRQMETKTFTKIVGGLWPDLKQLNTNDPVDDVYRIQDRDERRIFMTRRREERGNLNECG